MKNVYLLADLEEMEEELEEDDVLIFLSIFFLVSFTALALSFILADADSELFCSASFFKEWVLADVGFFDEVLVGVGHLVFNVCTEKGSSFLFDLVITCSSVFPSASDIVPWSTPSTFSSVTTFLEVGNTVPTGALLSTLLAPNGLTFRFSGATACKGMTELVGKKSKLE